MTQEILLTQADGIATLRVNRPAARNALNWTARALDLLLTSRIFSAEEALQMGLVQQVVDEAVGLDTAVTQFAHALIKLPQHALAASKQLVYAASHLSLSETNRLETELFVDLWSQPDHLEALAAFREKRPSVFGQ